MSKKLNGVRVDARLKAVESEESLERAKAELTKPDPDPAKAVEILKAGESIH